MVDEEYLEELLEMYSRIKGTIESRIDDFLSLKRNGTDEDILKEMYFCLLTPQSKARVCWSAVECIDSIGLLDAGYDDIIGCLKGVRFKYTKARNILRAKEMFTRNGSITLREILESFESPEIGREYLVDRVRGMGYKEASHFLRNTGYGLDLAILDRHILRNLLRLGVIDEMPKTLTPDIYRDIERKMRDFAASYGIDMAHLDLLLWYHETGEVFK